MAARPDKSRQWAVVALVLIAILVLAAPLLIEWWAGGFGIPRADDPTFARSAELFARSGQLDLYGYGEMMLYGLVVAGGAVIWVFGEHLAVLEVFGYAIALASAGVLYSLLRVRASRFVALFATASVVAFFPFARYAVSFMTDWPALLFQLIALRFGVEALRAKDPRKADRWLVAALLVAGLGFAVRETAITGVAAVVVAGCLTVWSDRSRRRRVLTMSATLIVACGALWIIRRSDPTGQQAGLFLSRGSLQGPLQVLFSAALALLPVSLLALSGLSARSWHRTPAAWLAIAAALAGVLLLAAQAAFDEPIGLLPGFTATNYPNPLLPHAALPLPWWAIAQLLALVGVAVAVPQVQRLLDRRGSSRMLVERARSADPALLAYGVFAFAALSLGLFRKLTGPPLVDERLIVPGIVGLVLVLACARREVATATIRWHHVAALAAVALISTVAATQKTAQDSAEWNAGEQLVATGIPSNLVALPDLPWSAYHDPEGIVPGPRPADAPAWTQPTVDWIPEGVHSSGNCGIVSSEPLDEEWLSEVGREEYRLWPAGPSREVVLYVNRRACQASGLDPDALIRAAR